MNATRSTAIILLFTIVAACQSTTKISSMDGSPEAGMSGFSWVIDDHLAAMAVPGGSRDLAEDLDYIAQQGVDALISLTEIPIDPEQLAQRDLVGHHIPVRDFTAPSLQQMDEFVALVSSRASRGESTAVHCTAGLGRSGTMVAAYLVSQGLAADAAIAKTRQLRPDSIETPTQEQAIRDFARFLSDNNDQP